MSTGPEPEPGIVRLPAYRLDGGASRPGHTDRPIVSHLPFGMLTIEAASAVGPLQESTAPLPIASIGHAPMHALLSASPIDSRMRAASEIVLVVGALALALSVMTVDQAVGGGWGPKLFVLARMAAVLLLCTWLLRRGGERWADVGLRRPARWWSVPLLVAVGFAGFLAIAVFAHPLLAFLGLEPPRVENNALKGDLLEYLFWAGPVTWGTAAFGEELLLRGFVLDRISKLIGPSRASVPAAVVLQAVVFGSFHFHQGPGGVIVTGTIGLLFGLMWLLGGRNLWPCIILHGIINTLSHYESYAAG